MLAECVAKVYTIEIVTPLGERAREVLNGLGYKNVEVRIGDGYRGWPEAAPFDAVAGPPRRSRCRRRSSTARQGLMMPRWRCSSRISWSCAESADGRAVTKRTITGMPVRAADERNRGYFANTLVLHLNGTRPPLFDGESCATGQCLRQRGEARMRKCLKIQVAFKLTRQVIWSRSLSDFRFRKYSLHWMA